ncbi:MAG TPA: anti-sigma factor RsbA family regulatory protein [Streptosporangiaceae bacterium]|jgi:anti-sigma regulatory factor (Ser/Thr protein kinase)|nr:anti-sigma factor RsbA family regulatory protein [Streptosporangiaceae bacterium]
MEPWRDRDSLTHTALFYTGANEYAAVAGDFIRRGLARGEPVMVAVPGPNALVLRGILGPDAGKVEFCDMTTLGRNPARIIPAVEAFTKAHPGRPVWYVGEPIWQARTALERAEAIRHEALLNIAFADRPIAILCPYDATELGPEVLAEAERTHAALVRAGRLVDSPSFAEPAEVAERADPLPAPPAGLEALTYRDDPGTARAFVRDRARASGLREPRLTDLVIAVGELAANTLRHTNGSGVVRVWAAATEIICEVRDSGYIRDVLAGRHFPAADAVRGHGLWIVHQVCDLVEVRTGRTGTTFRLHMALRT